MAKGYEVLGHLLPNGGWVISGNDFDSIIYDEGVTPITKKQFMDGFAAFDAQTAQQDQAKANEKAAILERLGITSDEIAALLS